MVVLLLAVALFIIWCFGWFVTAVINELGWDKAAIVFLTAGLIAQAALCYMAAMGVLH